MIKKLIFTVLLSSLITACSSQDQFSSKRYQVIESPAQQSIEIIKASMFQESNGILDVSNKSWGMGPRDYLERTSKLDPVTTQYYYAVNKSDKPVEGIMDVKVTNLRTFDTTDVIINFKIDANQKVLIKKTTIEKYDIRILKARFME